MKSSKINKLNNLIEEVISENNAYEGFLGEIADSLECRHTLYAILNAIKKLKSGVK